MADLALQRPGLSSGDAGLLSFSFRIPGIAPLLLIGLVVRLALAFIHGFGVDMGTFEAWSRDLAANGPWNFYQADKFTDYAPGYMYVLWLIGELDQMIGFTGDQYEYALKIPSIIADLSAATLLYIMLKDKRPELRLAVAAAYLLFPAALFIGALWGQVDSILAFFLLLSVYYIGRDRPVAGAVAFAVGFLIKPQAIAALPFLVFWILRRNPPEPRVESRDKWLAVAVGVGVAALFAMRLLSAPAENIQVNGGFNPPSAAEDFFGSNVSLLIPLLLTGAAVAYLLHDPKAKSGLPFRIPPRVWLECAVLPLVVVIVLITPFFELEPWKLLDVLENATNVPNYRVNSFWAYNFWSTGGIFQMGFHCDIDSACLAATADRPAGQASAFLGLDTRYWSVVLFTFGTAAVIVALRNARDTGFLALGTALSVVAFYLLLTRMHERYMFAAFLPFLLACALIHSRALWGLFVGMSAIHFLNLYHVFAYYQLYSSDEGPKYDDWLRVDVLHRWLEAQATYIDLPILPRISLDVPSLGTVETVQLLSIALVTAFVVLLPLCAVLVQRRCEPAEPA